MTTSTSHRSSSRGLRARWLFSDKSDGDFGSSVGPAELQQRCGDLVARPWTMLNQVHGSDVVAVTRPGEGSGASADAAVTFIPGAVVAVRTADCAGVVLVGARNDGTVIGVGVAHAGWRGLLDGVLQSTVLALRSGGADNITWYLGPCISATHYEFGEVDLKPLIDRFGPTVKAHTDAGAPALDLRAGVAVALDELGATPGENTVFCTASDTRFYSHRARSEAGRQVTAAWLETEDE